MMGEAARSAAAVAVAASMVVPFHCIICFDEFDFTDKTPMVLPCGHTYVCCACTKRLKRCMECREPLFWTPPPRKDALAQSAAILANSNHHLTQMQQKCHARYGTAIPALTPRIEQPRRSEPIPLPISRNVVMLAMMEAAERQAIAGEPPLDTDEDRQGEETSKIVLGLESMTGCCGTYAVKDALGVAVLPNDPRKGYTHGEHPAYTTYEREPFKIQKGQTVQIVSADDGVYQLARNSGFIVASESQLVKVNGPLDKSCQLQGMRNLVEERREELRKRLLHIDNLYNGLGQRILETQEEEPTHPVITDPLPTEAEEEAEELASHAEEPELDQLSSSPPRTSPCRHDKSIPQSPREIVVTPSDSGEGEMELMDSSSEIVNLAPRTPNTIDNSDIREMGSYYADENVFPGANTPYMCADFSFFRGDIDHSPVLDEQLSFDEPTVRFRQHLETAGALRGSGDVPPQIAQSASTGMIDFSTGLSGHRGLSSKSRAAGRAQQQTMSHRQIRMMGEHRGISVFRGSHTAGASKKQSP